MWSSAPPPKQQQKTATYMQLVVQRWLKKKMLTIALWKTIVSLMESFFSNNRYYRDSTVFVSTVSMLVETSNFPAGVPVCICQQWWSRQTFSHVCLPPSRPSSFKTKETKLQETERPLFYNEHQLLFSSCTHFSLMKCLCRQCLDEEDILGFDYFSADEHSCCDVPHTLMTEIVWALVLACSHWVV